MQQPETLAHEAGDIVSPTGLDGGDENMNDVKKTYYSISEVCAQTGLEPHVLRYWETEFPQLRPKKNRAGNRAYRDKDIEMICYIKRLLYEEKYTIPGAKKKLSTVKDHESEAIADPAVPPPPNPASAQPSFKDEVVRELREVLDLLRG